MDHKQFIDLLKNKDLYGAYILHGQEEYLREHALAEIIKKYMPGGTDDINYNTFAEDAGLADIAAAASTPPFMAEKRVVVYKNPAVFCAMGDNMKSEAIQKAAKEHIELADSLPRECILIYFARESIPAAHPFLKYLKENGRDVSFPETSKNDMPGYISWIAKRKGFYINEKTAEFLYNFTGGDLLGISNELDKLVDIKGDIGNAKITEVCTPSSNYNVFNMLRELTSGNFAGALSVYRSLIDNGDSPAAIIAMIARQYRTLAYAGDIEHSEKGNDYKALEKILGSKDFVIKNMMRYARSISDEQKRNIIAWCADADYEIKKGNITDEAAAENLIMKLLVARGR